MLVGCAGNETGEKDMPVPVPEKEKVMEEVIPEKTEEVLPPSVDGTDGKTAGAVKPDVSAAGKTSGKAVRKDAPAEAGEAVIAEETVTAEEKAAATEPETVADEKETSVEKETPDEKTVSDVDAASEKDETPAEKETAAEAEASAEKENAAVAEKETAYTPSEKPDEPRPGKEKRCNISRWYAGVEGGLDFAESGMSSFGAGGTRIGGGAGLAIGYRFNRWLSLEFGMTFGKTRMTAYGCCSDANLWLSDEGETFNAAVFGMNGGYYSELESAVFFQKYGLRANFDILGLIPGTADGKWSLELSPEVFVLGPDAKVSKAEAVIYRAANWQAGLGGRIQAGYAFLPWMSAGVFTGMDFGLGRHIDALPQNGHKRNYIWESGVRLVFSIPDKKSGR